MQLIFNWFVHIGTRLVFFRSKQFLNYTLHSEILFVLISLTWSWNERVHIKLILLLHEQQSTLLTAWETVINYVTKRGVRGFALAWCHCIRVTPVFPNLFVCWGAPTHKTEAKLANSSLNYYIWRSFCSFSYSQPCSCHIKLSLWHHNSSTHRKWTFSLDWTFFWTTMTSQKKVEYGRKTLNCKEVSKKNARYYSQEYSNF